MEDLIKILEDLHPEVDYMNCESLIDDKIFDSFDIISIVSDVDNEFDVSIPAKDIIPENFNSAKALWALIQSLLDEN